MDVLYTTKSSRKLRKQLIDHPGNVGWWGQERGRRIPKHNQFHSGFRWEQYQFQTEPVHIASFSFLTPLHLLDTGDVTWFPHWLQTLLWDLTKLISDLTGEKILIFHYEKSIAVWVNTINFKRKKISQNPCLVILIILLQLVCTGKSVLIRSS